MYRTIATLALLGFASFSFADSAKDTAAKMEGKYMIVGGERDGKPIPKQEIAGSVVVISGNSIVGSDKDKKEFFACTFTLDTTSSPMKIAMTSTSPKTGDKANGIIKMNGDTIELCYALPGADTPTDFKTKEKQNCFILKKMDK